MEISYDDPKGMGDLTYRYVEGLQWVMYYYYSGASSWGWFYDYHYAPRISVKSSHTQALHSLITDPVYLSSVDEMKFHFELGKPFQPFEQLMGVLPSASKDLIPLAYQVHVIIRQ